MQGKRPNGFPLPLASCLLPLVPYPSGLSTRFQSGHGDLPAGGDRRAGYICGHAFHHTAAKRRARRARFARVSGGACGDRVGCISGVTEYRRRFCHRLSARTHPSDAYRLAKYPGKFYCDGQLHKHVNYRGRYCSYDIPIDVDCNAGYACYTGLCRAADERDDSAIAKYG